MRVAKITVQRAYISTSVIIKSSLFGYSERHSRTSIGSLVGSGRGTQNQGGLLNLQQEFGKVQFLPSQSILGIGTSPVLTTEL